MGQILGTNQKVEIDVTNVGTTWQSLVCLRNSSVDTTNDVTQEQTNCGVLSAVGEPSMALNFDAICETVVVTSGANQTVSYKALLDAIKNKTLVRVRVQSPVSPGSSAGLFYHHEFSGYLTSLTMNQATSEFINFSGTIQSTGELDIIA
jgi:hypothetical protein